MSLIIRRHLGAPQAHILAEALKAGGISAGVGGENAACLYGHLLAMECTLIVAEEDAADAEAYLQADLAGEPLETDLPSESSPPDAAMPDTLSLLQAFVAIAIAAGVLRIAFIILTILQEQTSPLGYIDIAMEWILHEEILPLGYSLPVLAMLSSCSLLVVSSYRAGGWPGRIVVGCLALMLGLASFVS